MYNLLNKDMFLGIKSLAIHGKMWKKRSFPTVLIVFFLVTTLSIISGQPRNYILNIVLPGNTYAEIYVIGLDKKIFISSYTFSEFIGFKLQEGSYLIVVFFPHIEKYATKNIQLSSNITATFMPTNGTTLASLTIRKVPVFLFFPNGSKVLIEEKSTIKAMYPAIMFYGKLENYTVRFIESSAKVGTTFRGTSQLEEQRYWSTIIYLTKTVLISLGLGLLIYVIARFKIIGQVSKDR